MPRRTPLAIGILLSTTALIAPALADGTAPPPPELPRVPCSHALNDAKGDGAPNWVSGAPDGVFTNQRALDILSLNLRLTDTQLQVFVELDGAPGTAEMQPYEAADRYLVTFALRGKTFTYGIEINNPNNPAAPLDGVGYPTENMGTGGDDLPGSTWAIRPGTGSAPSWIVFTSPRDRIEKNLGAAIEATDQFTQLSAVTQVWTSQAHADADSTDSKDPRAKHDAFDDFCFGPPATSISGLTAPRTQVTDVAHLRAVLLDEAGKPLAGKPISFVVNDGRATTVTATTDASGVAVASYGPVRLRAGTYAVTARFPGDAGAKTSTATTSLTVAPESTVFAPLQVAKTSATVRTVTATLRDDDRAAVPAVSVDWYVNGKKAGTTKTDKSGRAVWKSARAGQSVQAKFAGVAGTYAAAVSKAVKV